MPIRCSCRAEGTFYAGNWFVQKCATGAGIFITGQVVALSQLPNNAVQGAVGFDVITTMVLMFGALSAGLASFAAFWLARFPITREQHEARIASLNANPKDALDATARADRDAQITPP